MFQPINRKQTALKGVPGPMRNARSGPGAEVASLEYIIYGKIIIDNIRLLGGGVERGVIGGGGPQGAFGARLWNDSVGLLSRSGTDIEPNATLALLDLDIDLGGWVRYPDIPTLHGAMVYDEHEQFVPSELYKDEPADRSEIWSRMLSQVLSLPPGYHQPKVIHLITEYCDEPMVKSALELRARGALFSLEPLIDFSEWKNREQILSLMPQVDVVTPDWPSASGIAGTDDPLRVLEYWSKLGPALVAVRSGQRGSFTWDRVHDRFWQIPTVPVPLVDPTGAGNSYGGGLCVGWAETGDALRAGCYGSVSASYLVSRVGLPRMTGDLMAEARTRLGQAIAGVRPLDGPRASS
jgi:sugar/nucleoside kinase (ribokinase family)